MMTRIGMGQGKAVELDRSASNVTHLAARNVETHNLFSPKHRVTTLGDGSFDLRGYSPLSMIIPHPIHLPGIPQQIQIDTL